MQCALGDNLACISVYPKPCSCTFEQLHLGTSAKFCFSVLITDLECSRRDEQNDTTLSFSNKVLPSAVYRNTANTAEIPRAVRGTSKTYRGTTLPCLGPIQVVLGLPSIFDLKPMMCFPSKVAVTHINIQYSKKWECSTEALRMTPNTTISTSWSIGFDFVQLPSEILLVPGFYP